MAMFSHSAVSTNPLSLCISTAYSCGKLRRKVSPLLASLSPSSASGSQESPSAMKNDNYSISAKGLAPKAPFVEPSKPPDMMYHPNRSPMVRFLQSTESTIEKVRDVILIPA